MQFRRLGDSDLEISEICLGSFLTYGLGVGRADRSLHKRCLRGRHQLLRHGERLRHWAAEKAWGEILSKRPRDSYILATKVYFPMQRKSRPWTWRDYGL
jgi:aryl-alcohol dehydrogenase-like predicted oxidoreductase